MEWLDDSRARALETTRPRARTRIHLEAFHISHIAYTPSDSQHQLAYPKFMRLIYAVIRRFPNKTWAARLERGSSLSWANQFPYFWMTAAKIHQPICEGNLRCSPIFSKPIIIIVRQLFFSPLKAGCHLFSVTYPRDPWEQRDRYIYRERELLLIALEAKGVFCDWSSEKYNKLLHLDRPTPH